MLLLLCVVGRCRVFRLYTSRFNVEGPLVRLARAAILLDWRLIFWLLVKVLGARLMSRRRRRSFLMNLLDLRGLLA